MNIMNDNYLEFKEHKAEDLNKLTLEQYLSQRFSCEILFNLLSSGEKCIYHDHKDRKYRYYDPFFTAKSKDQDDIELEFRNQIRCFQACFIDDVENGGFRYPDNLKKKEIIEDVKKWMNYAKIGNRDILYKTYQKFITLLEDEKKIIFEININKNEALIINDSNIKDKGIFKGIYKKEIQDFIDSGLICNKTAFEIEDNIKKDYEKENTSIRAILYQDPPKKEKIEKVNCIKLKKENKSTHSNYCC